MNKTTTLAATGWFLLSMFISLPVKSFDNFGDSLGYGLGMGLARSSFEGDFLKQESIYGLQLGFDYENNDMFATVEIVGAMSSASRMNDITMAIGGGYRWAKLGIGAITRKCRGRAEATSPRFPSVVALGETSYDTSSFPLYLRIHPLDTHYVLGTIDAYYGLGTKGKASSYFIDNSGNHYANETEIKPSGGNYGYRGSMLFRLGEDSNQAIMVDYRIDKGKAGSKPAPASGAVSSPIGSTIGIPVGFTNRIFIISYVTLY